ncbi:23176_t:CDS:2, partial [Racocetra persica]
QEENFDSKIIAETFSKNSDKSKDQNNTLELNIGLTFTNWKEYKAWMDNYFKKKGFNYKIKTSQKDDKNKHNHALILTIYETAPKFRKLIPEMLFNIEKYVIQGNSDVSQIFQIERN